MDKKPKMTLIWMHGIGDMAENAITYFKYPPYNGALKEYKIVSLQSPNSFDCYRENWKLKGW
jgi:hypothetical protein